MADIYFAFGLIGGLYALMQACSGIFERRFRLFWWASVLLFAALLWFGIDGQPGGFDEFKLGQTPDIIIRAVAQSSTIFN